MYIEWNTDIQRQKKLIRFLLPAHLSKEFYHFCPRKRKKKKNPRMDELMCRRREKREEMNEERPIGSLSCFGFKIDGGPPTVSLLEVDWVRVPTLYCNIKCTPVIRRKPDLEQITDKNQQTQRKGSRQDTRFTVNFLVEFVGSIKVLKEKQTKNSARMSMQCMLYSVGGFICQPRKRWLLRFYVHPSLAGPIG